MDNVARLNIRCTGTLILRRSIRSSVQMRRFLHGARIADLSSTGVAVSVSAIGTNRILLGGDVHVCRVKIRAFGTVLCCMSSIVAPLIRAICSQMSTPHCSVVGRTISTAN